MGNVMEQMEARMQFMVRESLAVRGAFRPALIFARGTEELGVVVGPAMSRDGMERLANWTHLATFISMFGATEAVYACGFVLSEIAERDFLMGNYAEPNDDPAARLGIEMLRLPTGLRHRMYYRIGDGGEITWEETEHISDEDAPDPDLMRMTLSKGLGFAPSELQARREAGEWLMAKTATEDDPGAFCIILSDAVS